jgi:hypothetical protein
MIWPVLLILFFIAGIGFLLYTATIEDDKENNTLNVTNRLDNQTRLIPYPPTAHCKIINKFSYPQICTQCGAPLNGNRCDYCGTKYN